jgi:hypothetical protein
MASWIDESDWDLEGEDEDGEAGETRKRGQMIESDDEQKPAKKRRDRWPIAPRVVGKVAPGTRLRAHWGVFNESLKEVALFDYNAHDEAVRKAAELTESKRIPHFVRVVKKQIKDKR